MPRPAVVSAPMGEAERARHRVMRVAIDVVSGLLYLGGSVLFWWPSMQGLAIGMFVLGSAGFCLLPVLRLTKALRAWHAASRERAPGATPFPVPRRRRLPRPGAMAWSGGPRGAGPSAWRARPRSMPGPKVPPRRRR